MSEVLKRFGLGSSNKRNFRETNSKVDKKDESNNSSCQKWKFASIDRIEESMFNKVLEKFYNLGIYGLARENIQNSLDGKILGSNEPVIVTIRTGQIEKEDIPGLEEIKERILCLRGGNSYTNETIEHMVKHMNKTLVDYVSFEDYNTKGLKGAKNGQSYAKEDTWSIYAYSKGVHAEDSDDEFEQYRGGSHGIGKIASNAASDLYMMFFANCDEHRNKHLGGTVQLIEHEYKNSYYRSTGYFTDEKLVGKHMTFYPYENNFHEIFSKDTRGLKIIIPFLREQFNDEKEIIKGICDSFFIAIIKGELEVIVNNHNINSKTIKDYILSKDYYIQEVTEIKEEFTPLYYDTYINKEAIPIKIDGTGRSYNFNLYFNFNEIIPKGRVAIIRSIGMKIEDKKIKGNANKPFNAVLVPDSINEDAFLKSLENESHTELSYKHIKDQNLQNNAKRFINNISKVLTKIIDEEIKRNNPTEGLMNTEDILYLVENQFKQDLSQVLSTVKINKGNKNISVVKVTPGIRNNTKKEDTSKDENKKEKKGNKLKKVKKKDDDDPKEEKKIRYSAHPDIVERLILGNKELLKFDFSDNIEMKNINKCDISISVVDGMGNEYTNEFNIKSNYKSIFDKLSGMQCKIQNNLIKNIQIIKNTAQLELELNENYNKALKFVYYLEV